MNRKSIFKLSLILLMFFLPCARSIVLNVKASDGYSIHNINTGLNYATIQEAIDASETLNGHTIFVDEGIYYDHVVVHKSISLIGQNRNNTIIDGNKTGMVVLVTADSVTIKELTVKNGDTGIYIDHSNSSFTTENNAINNVDAIVVRFSNNCTIYRNLAENNSQRGILVTNSWNFTVNYNNVYDSGWYGINANASTNGLIAQNNVNESYLDGIGLVDSDNCTVVGNSVRNNTLFGVWVDYYSDYSSIYHNNIINNGVQAVVGSSTNRWDNGIEGNYWSNYTGVDFYSGPYQNETGSDGIGDKPHTIEANNIDNYPLMGTFSSFNTSLGYYVNIISNSTIEDLEYFESNSTIRIHVSNTTANPEFGFCRIRVPHALVSEPYNVTVDGAEPYYVNYTLYDDGDNRWIYFSYQYSAHEILIASERLSFLILPLLMIATLPPVLVYRRKLVNSRYRKKKER